MCSLRSDIPLSVRRKSPVGSSLRAPSDPFLLASLASMPARPSQVALRLLAQAAMNRALVLASLANLLERPSQVAALLAPDASSPFPSP